MGEITKVIYDLRVPIVVEVTAACFTGLAMTFFREERWGTYLGARRGEARPSPEGRDEEPSPTIQLLQDLISQGVDKNYCNGQTCMLVLIRS